jgi:hypothetical protein
VSSLQYDSFTPSVDRTLPTPRFYLPPPIHPTSTVGYFWGGMQYSRINRSFDATVRVRAGGRSCAGRWPVNVIARTYQGRCGLLTTDQRDAWVSASGNNPARASILISGRWRKTMSRKSVIIAAVLVVLARTDSPRQCSKDSYGIELPLRHSESPGTGPYWSDRRTIRIQN